MLSFHTESIQKGLLLAREFILVLPLVQLFTFAFKLSIFGIPEREQMIFFFNIFEIYQTFTPPKHGSLLLTKSY